jgi:eukaryotic-like serine/threonine-protein kinase
MSFWKPNSLKDYLIHLGVILGTALIVVVIVFNIWLPITTNHGESITVPDIQGLTLDELEDFLGKRNFRFEVTPDSSYSPDFPPLAVLRQVPKPNTKVKENRKIYVTINAESPPLVRMPRVEDLSLKSAQMTLKSYDLKLGKVKYVPDVFFGVVHEARMNGRVVLESEKIEKGSLIDLIVGDGQGNTVFQSPMLLGLDQEEAEFVIIGSGLRVGKITNTNKNMAGFFESDSVGSDVVDYRSISPGTVQQQYPRPEKILRIGDPIDLWIYMPDSVSNNTNILDN